MQPVLTVVSQHAEEAAILRNIRTRLVRAPHVSLHHLARLDERIAAHLDGLAVAGEMGRSLCRQGLERPGAGEMFAAAVGAIEARDEADLERHFAVAGTVPEARRGLVSAFGWVSAQHLQGTIRALLESADPHRRLTGIAACAMHRVDPGPILATAVTDPDPALRARALRAAGQCGRRDLLPACLAAMADADADCGFQAARAALRLGDREGALRALHRIALTPGPQRISALACVLRAGTPVQVQALLKTVAQQASDARLLIQGVAAAGDIHHVGWLIGRMGDEKLARLAGEAFSTITGADLSQLDLDRIPPETPEAAAREDAESEDVAMDPDDNLPWPDADRVQSWWNGAQARFREGVRYFVGEPVAVAHCQEILRRGTQPQRHAAAEYLCLLEPGTPLFPTAAPAWRQQRWLGQGRAPA